MMIQTFVKSWLIWQFVTCLGGKGEHGDDDNSYHSENSVLSHNEVIETGKVIGANTLLKRLTIYLSSNDFSKSQKEEEMAAFVVLCHGMIENNSIESLDLHGRFDDAGEQEFQLLAPLLKKATYWELDT